MVAPANDNYADAQLISGLSGSVAFDTIEATAEVDEPYPADGFTVWFTWVAPAYGTVTFSTTPTPGDPDTALAFWRGSPSDPMPTGGWDYGDDDSGNDPAVGDPAYGASICTFPVALGEQWVFVVDCYDGSQTADGVLSWDLVVGPAPPTPQAPTAAEGQVWTSRCDEAQSDRIYLDTLGTVSALRYSSSFPGGAKALSCALAIDPLLSHRALSAGRDCGVTVGGDDVWMGTLGDCPEGSDGQRQITAFGDAATTSGYVALGLATHNALNANEVIDATRQSGRHSRLRRVDTFPMPNDGLWAKDGSLMMDEALTQNANANAKRWMIGLDRVIRYYPTEGTGEKLTLRARTDPGRTMDGQVTGHVVAYIDAATGLYAVEHQDSSAADTGGTQYPRFYLPDLSAYSSDNFTLYRAGSLLTAYVVRADPAATVMTLDGLGIDLARQETSGVYSRWTATAAGAPAVGATGVTATYTDGTTTVATGAQDYAVFTGTGSLYATGNLPPREEVVDLTTSGSFTMAEALTQLAAYLVKAKVQPHYSEPFTAAHGDLLNAGGVAVDLASVRAGFQMTVTVIDPTRTLDAQADEPLVTVGEVEYDQDTRTLTITAAETPTLDDVPVFVDPGTGLRR